MAYNPIDPKEKFNLDTFKDARNKVISLESSLNDIKEDPFNYKARSTLGGILLGNPGLFAGIAPDTVRGQMEPIAKEGRSKLEDYVLNNSGDVFKGIDPEMYIPLLMQLDLKEDKSEGKEKSEYNLFVKAVGKLKKFKKAASEGNTPEIAKAVGDILDYKGWKEGINYALYDSVYLSRLAGEASKIIESRVASLLSDGEGKPNPNKAAAFFKKSYELAVANKDKKYFSAIANLAYQEKK
jgi:hypothetical protein